ncbi:Hypothetical protein PHPALM_36581 [Phytophthora palmivora]|uniref:PiggyBac transposable element-derived protein domain-containing protein n=1 Tax=Phytophthora palmivora TaxID=4796 RepID=A0A2P4WZL0_9STRA|nr:Hypothetical protein PHPALM_36581 [Phytophthora palmivora]
MDGQDCYEHEQVRFQRGYIPPVTVALDEAMFPSRSSFNRIRVYLNDKPHNWGLKALLCGSTTAYCIRYTSALLQEHAVVLAPKLCYRQDRQGDIGAMSDTGSELVAVVRNLREVFGSSGPGTDAMRLIVTDSYYTSVPLAMQMLAMGYYSIDIVHNYQLGLSVSLVDEKEKG